MLLSSKKKGIIKVNIEVKGLGRFEARSMLADTSPTWNLFFYPQAGTDIGDTEIRQHLEAVEGVLRIHWYFDDWRYLIAVMGPPTITTKLRTIFSFASRFKVSLSAVNIIEAEMHM